MNLFSQQFLDKATALFEDLNSFEDAEKIEVINELRRKIHRYSPFENEPVDFVQWIKNDKVEANDYNPNVVAPPEMKLLALSVSEDGYTQPIVSWKVNGKYEVVDGFHRHRVGKENKEVVKRVNGYLPLVVVNEDRIDRGNRISTTIRHNRARGKHVIDKMSDIVMELKGRNWKNERIARELGMDEDEILRLCQITGLAELFADEEFSKSWDIEDAVVDDFDRLSDDINTYGEEVSDFRTINTNDERRIFHTHDKWECYKAGLYNTCVNGLKKDECEKAYSDFLSDTKWFELTLVKVISEWKYSCQHYLTNASMNRIAWLGQASMCYATGIPAVYRGGFYLMSEEQQDKANKIALIYLNKWLKNNNMDEVSLEEGLSGKQMELY